MNFIHLAVVILAIFELGEANGVTTNTTLFSIKNCAENGLIQVKNFSTGTDKYGNWYINGVGEVLKDISVVTKVQIDVSLNHQKSFTALSLSGESMPLGLDKSIVTLHLSTGSYPVSFNSSDIRWIVSKVPSLVFGLLGGVVGGESIDLKVSIKSTGKSPFLVACIDTYIDFGGILGKLEAISASGDGTSDSNSTDSGSGSSSGILSSITNGLSGLFSGL